MTLTLLEALINMDELEGLIMECDRHLPDKDWDRAFLIGSVKFLAERVRHWEDQAKTGFDYTKEVITKLNSDIKKVESNALVKIEELDDRIKKLEALADHDILGQDRILNQEDRIKKLELITHTHSCAKFEIPGNATETGTYFPPKHEDIHDNAEQTKNCYGCGTDNFKDEGRE